MSDRSLSADREQRQATCAHYFPYDSAGVVGPCERCDLPYAATQRAAGQPQPDLREQLATALRDASRTHPCSCGNTIWASCFHPGAPRHEERRATAVLAVVRPVLDAKQAEVDGVASRAAAAITGMGADVRRARGERDRYRLAYCSARRRAARASGTLDGIQSNLATMEEGLPCSAVANCDSNCCQQAEPKCGVINPRQAATCIDPPLHDEDHHDAFGHTWPRRDNDKPLFTPKEPS